MGSTVSVQDSLGRLRRGRPDPLPGLGQLRVRGSPRPVDVAVGASWSRRTPG
jgi:hypothetical protein